MAERIKNRRAGIAAAGLGVLLGFGVMFAGCSSGEETMTFSDEPPIRVRGGSMLIDLLGGGEFEEHGPRDRKNWKIKGDPPRERSQYTVAVVTSSSSCPSQIVTASLAKFTYSDGQIVEISANGNATKIKSTPNEIDHASPTEKHRLRYNADGYIRAIDIGSLSCTFETAASNVRVYLLD